MAYKNITLTDSNPGNYFYEEAMKTLRTNVQFSGKNNKVILLTSGHGNEGNHPQAEGRGRLPGGHCLPARRCGIR